MSKKYNTLIKKFIKYWIWWWIAAVVDLSLFQIFTEVLGIFYIYSAILSFSIVFIVWFLYQKNIAFSHKKWSHFKQGLYFLIFQLIWLSFNVISLWIFVDKLGFYPLYVAIFNKWLIFIWNFTMNYFFTFK